MTTSADPAEDELRTLLADALKCDQVEELTRLSGGASRETWRFSADGRGLVVQLQRAGDERDMLVEAAVVRAAGAAGVPVPDVVFAERRSDGPTFVVLDAIDGETIARKIQRDDQFATARLALAADCGTALAAAHSIPVTAVDGLVGDDQITKYTEALDELGEPHPTFELVRNWLIDHRPEPVAPVIVHGDFRLGNLIVGPLGLAAVIDWELAHLGDPMEDLGWLCVRAWRFGGPAPVAGLGDYADLFDAYTAAGGGDVDADRVRWWEVLGTWKWGVMCILQANAHRSGSVRSHELAAIGRRVCENEYDLLELLHGRWSDDGHGDGGGDGGGHGGRRGGGDGGGGEGDGDGDGEDGGGDDGGGDDGDEDGGVVARAPDGGHAPHDVPTAAELIEAVREWLYSDVLSATEGRLRFHTRVAMNTLAIVERELELGSGHAVRHAERLEHLQVGSDAQLATLIRSRGFEGDPVELRALLRESVVDKLLVANPGYLADAAGQRIAPQV